MAITYSHTFDLVTLELNSFKVSNPAHFTMQAGS